MEQKENKKPATKTSKDLLNLENKSREFALKKKKTFLFGERVKKSR